MIIMLCDDWIKHVNVHASICLVVEQLYYILGRSITIDSIQFTHSKKQVND